MFNKAIKKNVNQIELSGYIKSLISLMKPRVMSLVIFTCAVGFLTSNSNTSTSDALIGIFLVALGAGAAGCRVRCRGPRQHGGPDPPVRGSEPRHADCGRGDPDDRDQ